MTCLKVVRNITHVTTATVLTPKAALHAIAETALQEICVKVKHQVIYTSAMYVNNMLPSLAQISLRYIMCILTSVVSSYVMANHTEVRYLVLLENDVLIKWRNFMS